MTNTQTHSHGAGGQREREREEKREGREIEREGERRGKERERDSQPLSNCQRMTMKTFSSSKLRPCSTSPSSLALALDIRNPRSTVKLALKFHTLTKYGTLNCAFCFNSNFPSFTEYECQMEQDVKIHVQCTYTYIYSENTYIVKNLYSVVPLTSWDCLLYNPPVNSHFAHTIPYVTKQTTEPLCVQCS